jgi:hypothetical protein
MFDRRPSFLILIAFVVVVSASEAFACSCVRVEGPITELVRKEKLESAAVFTGKVRSIVERQGYGWVTVDFDVLDLWKGRLNKTVSLRTGLDDGNCGFKFKRGETYLVYARNLSMYSPSKSLSTHICLRTALLADAKADIPHLGNSKLPKH